MLILTRDSTVKQPGYDRASFHLKINETISIHLYKFDKLVLKLYVVNSIFHEPVKGLQEKKNREKSDKLGREILAEHGKS